MRKFDIAIVGAGPWGLAVLDRSLTQAEARPEYSFEIRLIDPKDAGPGVHDPKQDEFLLLNTMTEQIDSFSARHFGEAAKRGSMTFLQWMKKHHDANCPGDGFLPRARFGEYMRFVYETLIESCPKNATISKIHDIAIGLSVGQGSTVGITLDRLGTIAVDQAFVCTGHGLDEARMGECVHHSRDVISIYPISELKSNVEPQSSVGLSGLGLAAVDAVAALTEGRGGRFEEGDDGTLIYLPSGQEPTIYVFSRSGLPFACRPSSVLDLATSYEPIFCKRDALIGPSRKPWNDRNLDFERDLLPLLEAEMWSSFAIRRTILCEGDDSAERLREQFAQSTLSEACDLGKRHLVHGEHFNPSELLLGQAKKMPPSSEAFKEHFAEMLQYDISEALKGEAQSAYKHAVEMLRVLRNFIRDCIDFEGLSPRSRKFFFSQVAPRISGLIVGPPVSRGQEWSALMRAGILHPELGPAPSLIRDHFMGKWVARSTAFCDALTVQFDTLVSGYVSQSTLDPRRSPLLVDMYRSGLLSMSGEIGQKHLRLDTTCRPIDATGLVLDGVTILGVPTEGATYFNHYLPSPRSRARVFEQVDVALKQMFERHCQLAEREPARRQM